MALVVFTGGARSGKSSAAQELARVRSLDDASVTVAVFGRPSVDAEYLDRVADHRARRPVGWTTIEAQDSGSWTDEVRAGSLLLVDCLGTLASRAMEEAYDALSEGGLGSARADTLPLGFEEEFMSRFAPVVAWLIARDSDTIVVTNEVGDGVVPTFASGRFFRDELARGTRALVSAADASYLVVAGRLVELGALPVEALWPED